MNVSVNSLTVLHMQSSYSMCLIQGEQGSQGVMGPRGQPGEGFPGAKVSHRVVWDFLSRFVRTCYVLITDVVPCNVRQGDRGSAGERGLKGIKGDMGDPGTSGQPVSDTQQGEKTELCSNSHY